MGLQSLIIAQFRCFEDAEWLPAPGINLLTGDNASGKTSLLEAVFLLGRGRSFRSPRREALIRYGADRLQVVARMADGHNLGLEVSKDGWQARAAGQTVTQLSELSSWLPAQVLDPELHRLVQDGPGERRRYLDWATFHVKPGFLETWRNYQRALRQRNAALKTGEDDAVVGLWERALAVTGEALDAFRRDTVETLRGPVNEAAERLLGFTFHMEYRPGHSSERDLESALAAQRPRDRRAGTTQIGPHRADLQLRVEDHTARGWVSRGQQKLIAASLILGQASLLASRWGGRGVLLVDDPIAELDRSHSGALLELISESPFQVFVTALDQEALGGLRVDARFHVKQGSVRRVV